MASEQALPGVPVVGTLPVRAWAEGAVSVGVDVVVSAAVADTLVDWGECTTLEGQLSRASVAGVAWRWYDGLLVLGESGGECSLWLQSYGVPEPSCTSLANWCKVTRVRVGGWEGVRGDWAACVEYRAALRRAEGAGGTSYVVELYCVASERGESVRAALNVAQSAGATWRRVGGFAWSAAASVDLDASMSRNGVDVRRHVVLLVGATEGKWSQGSVIPVARRVVSESGTVSTVGHDSVSVGTDVRVGVVADLGGYRVTGSVDTGTPTGYVDGVPTVARSSVSLDILTRPDVWCVWGGADNSRDERGSVGGWLTGWWRRRGSDSWVVVGRVGVLRPGEIVEGEVPK